MNWHQLFTTILNQVQWATRRWNLHAQPNPATTFTALALIIAAVATPPIWRTIRHGSTIVHEMGHVTIAKLVGRRVNSMELHSDTSGLTITSGKPRGLGVLLTYLAGYTAPPLVGLALTWAALRGYPGAAMMILVLVLIYAFWLAKNLLTICIISVALAASALVFLYGTGSAIVTYVTTVGLFLLASGARTPFDLWATHHHGNGESSDASMAARHSLIPAHGWIIFFGVVAWLCVLQAAQLLVRSIM